jgi:hypothetical protein
VTEAAYFLSKEAEKILAPYVQALIGAKEPPEISSPFFAASWDYAFGKLLVDLKLTLKARIYGKVSDQTLADIRKSLENGVVVALLVPPRLYLLFPWDISWDGTLESLESFYSLPSVLVPEEVLEQVWELYQRMTN